MVQVSQENDKKSIFAEYYLSETVLDLSDNMVPTPKHLYGGRELVCYTAVFKNGCVAD